MKLRAGFVFLAASAMIYAATASAEPNRVSKHGEWTVFTETDGGKTCFIATIPTAQNPTSLSWAPQILITRGAITGGRNEPSIQAGYTYQEGSTVTLSIGSDSFSLFTDKDGAWVADIEPERRVVAAMKRGSLMIIKGTSERGNVTTDTYSLSGVTAGIKRITQLCP